VREKRTREIKDKMKGEKGREKKTRSVSDGLEDRAKGRNKVSWESEKKKTGGLMVQRGRKDEQGKHVGSKAAEEKRKSRREDRAQIIEAGPKTQKKGGGESRRRGFR